MTWDSRPVVVTGAGGFIGSHLVDRLLELGAHVTAFVRYNSRNDPGFLGDARNGNGSRLTLVYGDLTEADTVRNALRGADCVFHLAALVGIPYSYVHPNEVFAVNAGGTLNVLTAAKDLGITKVVVTSTSEVYGTALYAPIDEKHPKQPQSPYAASKIAADAMALSFHRSFELPVAVARPFNTFGPRQSYRAVIPTIIGQALGSDEIELGNTGPTRDFTFVADTVAGLIKVAESDESIGEEINLGSGFEISIRDLAQRIATTAGRSVHVRSSAERVRPYASEVKRLVADREKARRLTGWEPQVELGDGLAITIDWLRRHRNGDDVHSYYI